LDGDRKCLRLILPGFLPYGRKRAILLPEQDGLCATYLTYVSNLLVWALDPFHEDQGSEDREGEQPEEH